MSFAFPSLCNGPYPRCEFLQHASLTWASVSCHSTWPVSWSGLGLHLLSLAFLVMTIHLVYGLDEDAGSVEHALGL